MSSGDDPPRGRRLAVNEADPVGIDEDAAGIQAVGVPAYLEEVRRVFPDAVWRLAQSQLHFHHAAWTFRTTDDVVGNLGADAV
jgi:hypothetical protein